MQEYAHTIQAAFALHFSQTLRVYFQKLQQVVLQVAHLLGFGVLAQALM